MSLVQASANAILVPVVPIFPWHRQKANMGTSGLSDYYRPVERRDQALAGHAMLYDIVLNDITAEIEAGRAKHDFISSVSREQRDPHTAIKGFNDLLCHETAGRLNDQSSGDSTAPTTRCVATSSGLAWAWQSPNRWSSCMATGSGRAASSAGAAPLASRSRSCRRLRCYRNANPQITQIINY
jgi:signal transduction histidine kinase